MSALPPPPPSRRERMRAERAAREMSYPPAPDPADLPAPPAPEPADLSVPPLPEPPAPTPVMGVPQAHAAPPATGSHEAGGGIPPVAPSQTRTGVIQGVALPGMTPRAEQVTNRDEAPQASPVRRSLKERMAATPHSFADPTPMSATDNPLTQTNVGLATMTSTDAAFQIAAGGEVTSAEATVPIARPSSLPRLRRGRSRRTGGARDLHVGRGRLDRPGTPAPLLRG